MLVNCSKPSGIYYNLVTCFACFHSLFENREALYADRTSWKIIPRNGSRLGGTLANINDANTVSSVCQEIGEKKCRLWINCCTAAEKCCVRYKEFNKTSLINASCPSSFEKHSLQEFASRYCHLNGSWYYIENRDIWRNYSACSKSQRQKSGSDIEYFRFLFYTSIICNSISLVFLVPACAIFIIIRQLRRQKRIRIHIHFFLSLIITAILAVLSDALMGLPHAVAAAHNWSSMISEDTVLCKVIYVLMRYASSTTQFWMMCEALFLQRLIAKTFKKLTNIRPYYLLGWGVPMILIIILTGIRISKSTGNDMCWILPETEDLIIIIPDFLCVLINIVLLCHILKIIKADIQVHRNEPSNFRRMVKCCFMLIPLFGIQFIMHIQLPDHVDVRPFQFSDRILRGLQGAVVAILFCFSTSEVHTQVELFYSKHLTNVFKKGEFRKHSVSSTCTTLYQVSLPTTPVCEDMPDISSTNRRVRFSLDQEQQRPALPEMVPLHKDG